VHRARLAGARDAFVPDSQALRGTLIARKFAGVSLALIFTFVEPLQRARFPRDAARICRPA
jgi:hypothetical protein